MLLLAALALALALALVVVVWWLLPRNRQPRVIDVSPPRTRRLRPDEQARGEAAIARARELLAQARDRGDPSWEGFRNQDFPHAVARIEQDAGDRFLVVFSRRLIFVPPGTSRATSFNVTVGPKGLTGGGSASLQSNDSAPGNSEDWETGYAEPTDAEREAIAFVDRCFREGGDFGVYGNVTCGIEPLLQDCTVVIKPEGEDYHISVDPLDGHGHFLRFTVYGDGKVGQAMAGHYEPMPEEFDGEP